MFPPKLMRQLGVPRYPAHASEFYIALFLPVPYLFYRSGNESDYNGILLFVLYAVLLVVVGYLKSYIKSVTIYQISGPTIQGNNRAQSGQAQTNHNTARSPIGQLTLKIAQIM